jgi:hypothetical protein
MVLKKAGGVIRGELSILRCDDFSFGEFAERVRALARDS